MVTDPFGFVKRYSGFQGGRLMVMSGDNGRLINNASNLTRGSLSSQLFFRRFKKIGKYHEWEVWITCNGGTPLVRRLISN
jgi:hypothetical protein